MNEKSEKALAVMAETHDHMAEQQFPALLGRLVLQLAARGEPVSVESLKSALEEAIGQSPSARGEGDPRLDLGRLTAEKALNALMRAASGPGRSSR